MNNSASTQQGKGVPPRSELPLPDYDHLPTAALARVRSLDADGLTTRSCRRNPTIEVPVISVLEARLSRLDAGEKPTTGSGSFVPEKSPGPPAPRSIDQTTDAPKINPPSQGDPTNRSTSLTQTAATGATDRNPADGPGRYNDDSCSYERRAGLSHSTLLTTVTSAAWLAGKHQLLTNAAAMVC